MAKVVGTQRKSVVVTHDQKYLLRSEEGHEVEMSINPLSGALQFYPLHDQYLTLDYDGDFERYVIYVHIKPGGYRGK